MMVNIQSKELTIASCSPLKIVNYSILPDIDCKGHVNLVRSIAATIKGVLQNYYDLGLDLQALCSGTY